MNIAFYIICLLSLIIMVFSSPEAVLSAMLGGAEGAIELSITLIAVYMVWLSILKLIEGTGIAKGLTKLFKPLTKRLFPGESDKAHEYIAMNMSANLLGMGSAATPMGIKAIAEMHDGKTDKASHNMVLLIVINCTSLQIFPGTIIGMRAAAGSVSASDIIIPTLIATTASTVLGVVICKIFAKFSKKP